MNSWSIQHGAFGRRFPVRSPPPSLPPGVHWQQGCLNVSPLKAKSQLFPKQVLRDGGTGEVGQHNPKRRNDSPRKELALLNGLWPGCWASLGELVPTTGRGMKDSGWLGSSPLRALGHTHAQGSPRTSKSFSGQAARFTAPRRDAYVTLLLDPVSHLSPSHLG